MTWPWLGAMAEWSKALCLGEIRLSQNRSLHGREFESHSHQGIFFNLYSSYRHDLYDPFSSIINGI